ncbi:diaminopimelate epimerase [Candidatus Sumerlaeota bacterium]|nr:diaminopimelate epimerase [Candidatus Sumerlaeota bacterium]
MRFFKLSGAGNDFVAFDNREGRLPTGDRRSEWIARLCARGEGVGADGALILEPSAVADIRMRYHNADGGETDMCGNGIRCVARLTHHLGVAGPTIRIESAIGTHTAEVLGGDRIRVTHTPPEVQERECAMELNGISHRADRVLAGVPHVVIEVESDDPSALGEIDVGSLGPPLRRHAAVMPKGANINWLWRDTDGTLHMRTYERGVEAETLACGTGALSCAVSAALRHGQTSPVTVITRSGHRLSIHFARDGETFHDVLLEGPATITFTGELGESLLP